MEMEYFRQIVVKYSNIKFHENPSSGGRVVSCWRTDCKSETRDEANSRFRYYANSSNSNRCSTVTYERMVALFRLDPDRVLRKFRPATAGLLLLLFACAVCCKTNSHAQRRHLTKTRRWRLFMEGNAFFFFF